MQPGLHRDSEALGWEIQARGASEMKKKAAAVIGFLEEAHRSLCREGFGLGEGEGEWSAS